MPTNDPVMAVPDKLPLTGPPDTTPHDAAEAAHDGAVPFGLRFAVRPIIPSDSTIRATTQSP
jgi:hypothetical protein